jgi:putative two-component system response regulator
MSYHEARENIIAGRGKHFDPDIVDAFIDIFDEFCDVARQFQPKN